MEALRSSGDEIFSMASTVWPGHAPWIEASGGIQLQNVRSYAEAGPDAISIGALTHSVNAADIALELESESQ